MTEPKCLGCNRGFINIIEGCPLHDAQWGIADRKPVEHEPMDSTLELKSTGRFYTGESPNSKLHIKETPDAKAHQDNKSLKEFSEWFWQHPLADMQECWMAARGWK